MKDFLICYTYRMVDMEAWRGFWHGSVYVGIEWPVHYKEIERKIDEDDNNFLNCKSQGSVTITNIIPQDSMPFSEDDNYYIYFKDTNISTW